LTPDFRGHEDLIAQIVKAGPDVFAHNIETVKRLQKRVRDPRATYEQSMKVLKYAKELNPERFTKTSIMLGLGEEAEEVMECLRDLRAIGCDIVTFGQYLQPTKYKLKVEKYYTPEEFVFWQKQAENMGFLYVASGPLVRSSYKAGEFFMKGVIEKKRKEEALLQKLNSSVNNRELLDTIYKNNNKTHNQSI
jgi:lipoic acid synthetase